MNTQLTVLYRDADNYKTYNSFVIKGLFTEEQFQLLKSAGDEFVPHELGLQNPALNFSGMDQFPNVDIDHGYCTLCDLDGVSYEEFLKATRTNAEADTQYDCASFLEAYIEAPCDAAAEFDRLCQVA